VNVKSVDGSVTNQNVTLNTPFVIVRMPVAEAKVAGVTLKLKVPVALVAEKLVTVIVPLSVPLPSPIACHLPIDVTSDA
jgi:hypothetical protein